MSIMLQINSQAATAQDILSIYIASGGIIPLTLERINTKYPNQPPFTQIDLQQMLTQPEVLQQLQEQVKAFILMKTFEASVVALATLTTKLPRLEPYELSRTTTNLIEKLGTLTDRLPKTEINMNQFVWENLLPAEAQEAIRFLQTQPAVSTAPMHANGMSNNIANGKLIEHEA